VTPPPEPDGQRTFQHLQAQVDCGPRVPGSPAAACARRYFMQHLRKSAARVGLQSFELPDPYGGDSLRLMNVMAHFYPERSARVLLGAHYDSRPRADRDTGAARELPVPGANDGASGVAVLLEIADLLGRWDPGIGVDLVFFDGEDYGKEGDTEYYLLGSRHFVRSMGGYRPRAMLLLDMVGDADLRIPMEGNSLQAAPGLTSLVFAVAESLGVTQFDPVPGPAILDDHVPFLRDRIPAVNLIDFDYPPWHTTRDLPEACSAESLEAVARVVLHVLARLAVLEGP
jgi:Zn-dependent M28 family amino/carboxypeptidase